MQLVAIVASLALIEYTVFLLLAGHARGRAGVPAPAMTGNTNFERCFRAQANTVEQLVVFLPALWLFGRYVSADIGALIGVVFLIGRAVYAFAYVADPTKRSTGFILSFVPSLLLLLGGLGGAVMAML